MEPIIRLAMPGFAMPGLAMPGELPGLSHSQVRCPVTHRPVPFAASAFSDLVVGALPESNRRERVLAANCPICRASNRSRHPRSRWDRGLLVHGAGPLGRGRIEPGCPGEL